MGQYTNKGLYNSYKKNNKERAELDYYSTPTNEVTNILNTLKYDFSNKSILEPCVGGGHMMNGILQYLNANNYKCPQPTGTDVQDRGYHSNEAILLYGDDLDFLGDNYPIDKADIIIMNPPYATLEPFLIRALEIAQEKLIVLCRTQALEGASRYKNIFAKEPPSEIYQYIDRIQCWKNGEKTAGSSAQAYCWLVWNKTLINYGCFPPLMHWIHRAS